MTGGIADCRVQQRTGRTVQRPSGPFERRPQAGWTAFAMGGVAGPGVSVGRAIHQADTARPLTPPQRHGQCTRGGPGTEPGVASSLNAASLPAPVPVPVLRSQHSGSCRAVWGCPPPTRRVEDRTPSSDGRARRQCMQLPANIRPLPWPSRSMGCESGQRLQAAPRTRRTATWESKLNDHSGADPGQRGGGQQRCHCTPHPHASPPLHSPASLLILSIADPTLPSLSTTPLISSLSSLSSLSLLSVPSLSLSSLSLSPSPLLLHR